MATINWADTLHDALANIHGTEKLLFLFFHHPECAGSTKTRDITFNDPGVMDFINTHFVGVSVPVTEAQEHTARYGIELTPTFIIADEDGRELERWVGYLPPKEFISQIYLADGLAEFHKQRFREAEAAFEWIIDNIPESDVAPEARYFMGVALYKESGDQDHLERTWLALHKRYPDNCWTKKASAWS